MKTVFRLLAFFCGLILICRPVSAQFTTEEYEKFLLENEGMTYGQLLEKYPAGKFDLIAPTNLAAAEYGDSVIQKFKLTAYERELIAKHGFMVTERLQYATPQLGFYDVWTKDLPVFISADAILHAFFVNYRNAIADIEQEVMSPIVANFLKKTHEGVRKLGNLYPATHPSAQAFRDADVFLCVAERLLSEDTTVGKPYFPTNETEIQRYLTLIEAKQAVHTQMFSTVSRRIDFSLFTVRGYYTETEELQRYFRTMSWLSTADVWLINPNLKELQISQADILRNSMLAIALTQAADFGGAMQYYDRLEQFYATLLGPQNNVTMTDISAVITEMNITDPAQLTKPATNTTFTSLIRKRWGNPLTVITHIMLKNSDTKIELPVKMCAFGRRLTLDSYVLGSVVYDRIPEMRMRPSVLDVMFTLGNNAVIQLLEQELEQYDYSVNVAGMRYLLEKANENMPPTFYNKWLQAIQALNPPQDRTALTPAMRTSAWWQKSLTSQLGAYTQLKNSFLLMATMPYSAGLTCEYPKAYLEPVPEVYESLADAEALMYNFFKGLRAQIPQDGNDSWLSKFDLYCGWREPPYDSPYRSLTAFCGHEGYYRRLALISQKIKQKDTTDIINDIYFLRTILYSNPVSCNKVKDFDGWYNRLMYLEMNSYEHAKKSKSVIADIFTQPFDESANEVGKVMHIGTGPFTMAVIVVRDKNGCEQAYSGPVYSYREYMTSGYKRLTDEEWRSTVSLETMPAPSWTNLYMAGAKGEERTGEKQTYITSVEESNQTAITGEKLAVAVTPNPVTTGSIIVLTIPERCSRGAIRVELTTSDGKTVAVLAEETMPAGTFVLPLRSDELSLADGLYFVSVKCGGITTTASIVVTGK